MSAFYNERDPYAAQWLRSLIDAGHIAPGVVDERSITEIEPDELRDFTQCHFFAGIGVWSYALRRAGWSDEFPVWTGSCPCQPFSNAGQQKGFDDERHLWPVWFRLIAECRPPIVLGEQVASALDWLDLVSADLEGSGYAFAASDLCAAGFGGAHIRQRLYFTGTLRLADRKQQGLEGHAGNGDDRNQPGWDDADQAGSVAARGGAGRLDDASSPRCFGEVEGAEGNPRDEARLRLSGAGCGAGRMADTGRPVLQSWIESGNDAGAARPAKGEARQFERSGAGDSHGGAPSRLADADLIGTERGTGDDCQAPGVSETQREPVERADVSERGGPDHGGCGAGGSHGAYGHNSGADAPLFGWHVADWLFCRDGKWRPVEPGTFPLVDETPARVGRLRAYGNALDAETATQFCAAVMEALAECSQ